jgi:leucyl-tRNA synthetase
MTYGPHFERALVAQILMLAPMAPHFASELWCQLQAMPHRLNVDTAEIQWDRGVFDQPWPVVDKHFKLDYTMKVNGYDRTTLKLQCQHLDKLTHQEALDLAFNQTVITDYICDKKIRTTNFVLYPGYEANLNIILEPQAKAEKAIEQ